MIPVIDKKKTGIHLRRIMEERGLSAKEISALLFVVARQECAFWEECRKIKGFGRLREDFYE